MNNLKSKKGGASLRNLKRLLCLLLVLTILPVNAFAASGAGTGTDPVRPGTGSSTGFGWKQRSDAMGFALGIQQMQGSAYTIKPQTKEDVEKTKNSIVKSQGMANAIQHFTRSYPHSYEPSGGQGLLFMVPAGTSGTQYITRVDPGGSRSREVLVPSLKAGSYTPNRNLSNTLFKLAISRISNANPNPTLYASDFSGILTTISESDAKNLIGYIFSSSDYGSAGLATEINAKFKEIADDQPEGYLEGDNPTFYNARRVCNYAAIILSLAKLLPQENWSVYESYVSDYVCNVLAGSAYQPIVITGEVAIATMWGSVSSSMVHWRTATDHMALKAGVGVEVFKDADTYFSELKDPVDSNAEVTRIIMRRASSQVASNPGTPGSESFMGVGRNGEDNNYGTFGRNITSVESAYINAITDDNGPWKLNAFSAGPWGCAIFGAEMAVIPNDPVPPTPVDLAAMGEIGITVEDKKYEKEVGGYSQVFNVTVTVSLGADFGVGEGDNAATSEEQMKSQGAGIANTLRWLQSRRDEGQNIPDPSISIWLAQAEPIDALSDSASTSLINDTYGYFGDGNEITFNDAGNKVASNQVEASLGAGFTWTQVPASSLVFKDGNIPGMTVGPGEGGSLQVTFTDLNKCAEYFTTHDDTLVFVGEYTGNGTLEDDTSKIQHWFKVGARVQYYGPISLEDMKTVTLTNVGLYSRPKYDYSTITATPEDDPYYYSKYQRPYSELKQGTVPVSGGGSDEKFNSMTGTPTFTETNGRSDFKGTSYENAGHYYQYFASGGSEFVVQFDGKYHYNESATRTFTFNFSGVNCDQSTGSYKCPGHPQPEGPPSYCDDSCVHAVHCANHPHVLSSSCSFSVTYNGLSYVEITNLKVWKLSEAKLDGTRELLDTSEVYAEVKSTAPGISYNIAASNTAEQGRMVYEFMPKGTGEGGDRDNLVWNRTSSSSCSGAAKENMEVVKGILSGANAGATMLSDFIVLHTTNGDQSILYFETDSDSMGVPIMSSIDTSSHSPTFGSDNATITVTVTSSVADGCEFPELKNKDNETLQNLLWKGNSLTSEGCGLPEDGITYGGYNGNYSSMSTKYKSSGHAANMTNWSSTAAYKNASGVFGSKSNSELYKATVTKKLRLLNDELVIPDTKQNGEYIVGNSSVFYENIVDFGNETPNFPIVPQKDFGSRKGFVVKTTYSPSHDKINDVVVYNPVSNQNAIVVSLPKDRDQRVSTHVTTEVDKSTQCPGDSSCPYLQNVCTVTQHVHTEACYQQISYEVHGPNNVHEHTAECQYIPATCDCSHCGNPSCPNYCSNHRYACSSTCGIANGTGGTYTCGNLPLNKHVCGANSQQAQNETINRRVSYSASGTDVYTFTARDSGTVRFFSTWNDNDPRGRVYINGTLKVDNDDGYGSLNFDCGTIRFNAGDSVRLNIYQYGSRGSGSCDITIQISYDSPPTPTVQCYTMYKSILSCNDPHHAYSYNWKLYTYGLKHESGAICSGRGCADNTNLIFPTQEKYTVAQCAAGYIVKHANGDVHLTTQQGICTYCGNTYKELLSSAQNTDREPDPSEYECYTYGDTRCWAPCNNPENHNKYTTTITDNGTTYEMGDFINLDWPFTIYFPNTGDFYGTGAKWSSTTSAERGWGYTNGMDATEWTKSKWVEFPFAVVYNDQIYLPYERIYLSVPETVFEFYVPLHDSEMANAEVKFGSVAINAQNGEELECGANANHNISNITYKGKPKAHHHNADKRTYIDVVGRIGNLALNDTGDFRYSNLFKTPLSEWLVKNVVKKVDPTKQNYIMLDGVDVRKVPITDTGVAGNTHNTRPERGSLSKILNFPLTPAKNNIEPLQRQPIRIGYDSYFDLTTLGNYYGNQFFDEEGNVAGTNLVLIKPHYYRLDLDTGEYKPVDVYMDVNGNYVLINDNDSNTVSYNGSDANVSLNWVEEKDRRNYSGSEVTNSEAVAQANNWVQLPKGSSWVYGNYNILNLTQRNRTFVGSEYTYNDKDGWNSHKDPSDRLPNVQAAMQGQRWHFNVGLPSSAVFVYSGQQPTQANIDACSSGNAVVFCALEIYAQGEVWTLAYDGSNVNVPFTVTPGGKTYDPVVPYPDSSKNPKGEEMPIVSIISINHSSKEDMNVIGTQ